jgi:hypothetical protein
MLVCEEEWKVKCVGNFNESQWGGSDMHGGSWEVTPPASPAGEIQSMEGDLSWPALATQVSKWCGSWGPFPSDTLEVGQKVKIEERSSVEDSDGEHSACRSL